MLQEWNSELPEKQSTPNTFIQVQQSDTAVSGARTVRSGPPRAGNRRRPVSDRQSYHNSGVGSGRLVAAETRVARSSPYNAVNRQRLSSSEELPVEV